MTYAIRPQSFCLIALALAGCQGGKPTGQVVAKVNGEEITRRDVEAEIGATHVDQSDMVRVQPLVVDRIVSRTLLVTEAEREGLAKSPDFLAAERRARDVLLIEMYQNRHAGSEKAPDQTAVSRFIRDNPQMFANRRVLKVDQIRTAVQGLDSNALQPLTTLDQVATYLTAQGRPFERVPGTIDTATLPRDITHKLDTLPPGMPFVAGQNGMAVISAITGVDAVPIPAEQQSVVAIRAMGAASAAMFLDSKLKALKQSAKIEYQPGFAPPTPTKSSGTSGK